MKQKLKKSTFFFSIVLNLLFLFIFLTSISSSKGQKEIQEDHKIELINCYRNLRDVETKQKEVYTWYKKHKPKEWSKYEGKSVLYYDKFRKEYVERIVNLHELTNFKYLKLYNIEVFSPATKIEFRYKLKTWENINKVTQEDGNVMQLPKI